MTALNTAEMARAWAAVCHRVTSAKSFETIGGVLRDFLDRTSGEAIWAAQPAVVDALIAIARVVTEHAFAEEWVWCFQYFFAIIRRDDQS